MNREEFLKQLKKYGEENEIPNISFVNANFIRDLIKIQKTQKMLEIGTANGFSAVNFGIELEKNNGKLWSIEFSSLSHNTAKDIVKETKLENTIELILGNALDIIPSFEDNFFDFIFIDGMKRRTKDFLELSLSKLKTGGIIIIDDVIKFKEKMIGLEEYLKQNKIKHNIIPIDIEDGIIMIIKE